MEDETLSCGTGCTAAAISIAQPIPNKQQTSYLQTNGGPIKVLFNKPQPSLANDIWLEGPATFVFDGVITTI